jgi:hypothetical protein
MTCDTPDDDDASGQFFIGSGGTEGRGCAADPVRSMMAPPAMTSSSSS